MKILTTEKIERQVLIWNRLAVSVPIFFVSTSVLLYWLNIMHYEQLFIIALVAWALVAVTWWFWTMVSIIFLARLLANASTQLEEIRNEVKEIRNEIT